MRAILYGGLPVVFVAVVGAIATAFDGRRRKLTPSSSVAGR
jgi:hypothetical protein